MDGTLTPARQKMEHSMSRKLTKLAFLKNVQIGIISGSGLNYILEQCEELLDRDRYDLDILLMPCNGTKMYEYNLANGISRNKLLNQNIRTHLGDRKFKRIITTLLRYQIDIMENYECSEKLNFTGTFIDNRDTLINWCPIGRNANNFDRLKFKDCDEYHDMRSKLVNNLRKDPVFSGLTIKIGGDTSIDIYPHGWDKTFILKETGHFKYYELFFVGDRCGPNGNDREIYEYVKDINEKNAFEVKSPDITEIIIDSFIKDHDI